MKTRDYLLTMLKKAKTDIHASNFTKYVWFQLSTGKFLYNDRYVKYEIIEDLIYEKQLIFKKIENHQGEKMAKYILTY